MIKFEYKRIFVDLPRKFDDLKDKIDLSSDTTYCEYNIPLENSFEIDVNVSIEIFEDGESSINFKYNLSYERTEIDDNMWELTDEAYKYQLEITQEVENYILECYEQKR